MTDINLNQVPACLQNTNDFGGTTIHNVCTGTETRIPWGSADWFWNSLGLGVVGFIVLVIVAFAILGIIATAFNVAEGNAKDRYYRNMERNK